jgi:putative acetyltransferase
MNISYRLIEEKDNIDIAKLIRTVLEEFGVNRPGTVYTDPTTDNLHELFQEKNAYYYLATYNYKIIGGCGIYPTIGLPENCIELVKLYLNKDFRGLGVGKTLIEKAISKAKELNYRQIYLESLPELNNAVNLYNKIGFKKIEKRLGNSGHYACDIIMLKEI